jgi:hypothetical protein
MNRLLEIDAANYVASELHGPDRVWPETNCYVDLWIEVLHALGLDPFAALAFTLSVDFDGAQWDFFKPPPEDLRALYGLEVAETNPWRGLEHDIERQMALGRLLTIEVDSWFLPDTAGVSYREEHVKSSIVPNFIDVECRTLGYFHGRGYHELNGDDYTGLFEMAAGAEGGLPPYVELIRMDRLQRRTDQELLEIALGLLSDHIARRPASNPFGRFRAAFDDDLAWLRKEGGDAFHHYAFATLRQLGSAFELAASFTSWLAAHGEHVCGAGIELANVASLAKAAQFQLARLARGREGDLDAALDGMEKSWDVAMSELALRYA